MSFTYRGLTAQLDRHLVTDEEIDRNLQRLQQQNPRIAENQTLVLGSGMFIPGFEEQLVDKVPEEKVIVKVQFPEQYHAESLAGKDAEFHCVIHSIRIKTPYELDDVFAKEVGHCENMEQMRRLMGESLQSYADERGEMDLQDRLLRQAADTLEFTPSEAQLEAEIDNQIQNLQAQLAQQGLNLEMYCQFLGTTEEQLREDSRADAMQSVRMKAAIETIVDLEGMTAEENEIAEAYTVICRQNNMTMEELKQYVDAEFEQAVIQRVLTTKAMALIRETAVITTAN